MLGGAWHSHLALFSSSKDKCRVSLSVSKSLRKAIHVPEQPVHPVWAFHRRSWRQDDQAHFGTLLPKDIRSCWQIINLSLNHGDNIYIRDQDSDYLKDSPGRAPHNWKNSSQHAEPHPGQNSQRPVPETPACRVCCRWTSARREGLHQISEGPAT